MRVSVSTKILVSLLGVLAAFGAAAAYSMVTLRTIGAELEIVDGAYIPLTKVVAELGALGSKSYLDLKELTTVQDPRSLRILGQVYPASIGQRVTRLVERGEQLVSAAESRKLKEADAAFFARARLRIAQVKLQYQKNIGDLTVFLGGLATPRKPDVLAVRDRLRQGDSVIRAAVLALTSELDGRITTTVLSVRREQRTGAWAVMALTVLAAAVGLFLALYAHQTLRPIERLTAGVARIAHGDYTERVTITSKDEIGVLATEFNSMAASLLEREHRLSEQQRELAGAYRAVEAEKRFSENIVQSIRSAVVVTGPDGLVTAVNVAARELLALEVGTSLIGVAALAGAVDLTERVRAALTGVESVLEAVPAPDGRAFDLKLSPLRDPELAVHGALLIADDVTERVRTKEALVKSERLAAVGRIAAQITHEIRNPLSSIGLNTELLAEEVERLREGRPPGEAEQLVRSIGREVDRLTDITEGYLRYARLPRPRLEAEDVNAILSDLLRFMDEELRARAIVLASALAPGLPDVLGDENQLRQAFLNLLRNACEAMRGGGELRVGTSPCDDGVRISIGDSGAGIAPEHLSRIFDPFFSTKDAGTGLGLALTQQILEEHGGRITCESRVGVGTMFHVVLRAARVGPLLAPPAGSDDG